MPHHVPSPISTAPMEPTLPSAVPLLRSFAQEPSQDQIPQSPSTARPFRTPPRTRPSIPQTSDNEPADTSDDRIRSVPPTPGSFRSRRRREGWTARRVSERVGERDDARGRSRTLAGDGDQAGEDDDGQGYATFPSRQSAQGHSANRRSLRTPSTARSTHESDASITDDAPLEGFTLPRVFRTISRQASGIFGAGGFGRGSRAPSIWKGEEREEGVRMWYSSYDTIDWLHDQIKDSRRVKRLRDAAKHSLRGKLVNAADRATGWLVVSLVGILTAIMAFAVIKVETLLFGLKFGYCGSDVLRTRARCDGEWFAWNQKGERRAFGIYVFIALCLAWVSTMLTVYLTASTRFQDAEVVVADKPGRNISGPSGPSSETTPLVSKPLTHSVQSKQSSPPARILYFAAGSGIPEIKTILSGFVIKGYLGSVTLFVKSLGLALSVASGMSLGKEGPMVHIASCIGNITARQFRKYELNEAKRREVLSAACAAGVSVAFGAPIGGTLFSWEESSTYFPAKVMWRSFFCAAIAALTLRLLDPYGHGRLVLLEVNYSKDHHSNFIYLIAILLGVIGGIYGALWARMNIAWSKRFRAGTGMKRHPVLEVLLISIVTSLASYSNPLSRMGGVEYVAELFSECKGSHSGICSNVPADILANMGKIFHSVVVRAGLAIITFGIRVPAGIFIPSLAAGAAFGRITGLFLSYISVSFPSNVHLLHGKEIVPGVYALIGAAATLAGVTRTTVSLVVIVVELTATLDYVVPVALTVLVAKTVADALEHDGIYDLVIKMNQFPFLDAKKEHHFDRTEAVDIADRSLPYLRVDSHHTRSSLQAQVDDLKSSGLGDGCFPCLASKGNAFEQHLYVVGILAVNELQHVLTQVSDEPDAMFNLSPERSHLTDSLYPIDSMGGNMAEDPYDIVPLLDLSPLLVLENSPLELVQQLFTKLGARVVIVINAAGHYRGTILKKTWLKYLEERE